MLNTIALLLLVYPYLTIFIKSVEKCCFYKRVSASKLVPGDWVEENIYEKNKLVYKKKLLGIEEGDIKRLIKAKVKNVLVKEGIPFIPPFFIGVLITIISGKIMFIL